MVHPLIAENGSPDKFDRIVAELTETGFSICENFVSPLVVNNMAHEARSLWQQGEFRHARVGKGISLQVRPEIRNDNICWLDAENPTAIQSPYFNELEILRHHINHKLFLGLFEFEGHFALYPPGSFYNIHYDRFIGALERMVTCILYLNHDWKDDDGGALQVHEGTTPSALPLPMQVLPQGGRLVCFLSEAFPHEVLPANRDRLSLTGWFRIRA